VKPNSKTLGANLSSGWVVLDYLCPFPGLSNFKLTDIPLDHSFEGMTTEIKLAER